MAIGIEFYWASTGEIVDNDKDYFVYGDGKVYRDNGWTTESQEASVSFDDFVSDIPNIGWRVKIT